MYPNPALAGMPPGAVQEDPNDAMSPLKRAMMMQMTSGGGQQQPVQGSMGTGGLEAIMPLLKMLMTSGGGMGG